MRVLHIINSLRMGGAEKLLVKMACLMKSNGIDVDLLVLDAKGAIFTDLLRERGISFSFSHAQNLYSFLQIQAIKPLSKNQRYDLIHTHLFPAQLWSVSALNRSGIPLITTEHSTFNRRRDYRIFKGLDRWMYGKYKRIICNSRATKDCLEQWLPETCSKTVLIHNGIDLEAFDSAQAYPKDMFISGYEPGMRLLLKVSSFSQAKDHATVIRALAELPDRYHLLLVGEGPKEKEIRNLTTSLRMDARVHFLGVRTDVSRIAKSADLLIQSSHWEGFGLSVVEGMACGLPVIVSQTPGLADIFGQTALLVPTGNPQALAEMIRKLEDPLLYQTHATMSREEAKHFSLSQMVSDYQSVYEQVMRSPSS